MFQKNRTAIVLSLVIVLLAAGWCLALSPVNKTRIGGVAIKGYDPVAYFTNGEAVKGLKKYTHQWNGAKWRFAGRENLELFQAAPEKYAPQYGGYCAWAVAQGKTAGVDPKVWKIVEGKLYLNYDQSVQEKWEQDIEGNIQKADQSWPKLLED